MPAVIHNLTSGAIPVPSPGPTTDATPAINAALLAAPVGGVVQLDPAYYLCAGQIVMPPGRALVGTWRGRPSLTLQDGVTDPRTYGTTLGCSWPGAGTTPTSPAFLKPVDNCTVAGLAIVDNLQGTPGTSGWVPRPYMIGTDYGPSPTYIGDGGICLSNLAVSQVSRGVRLNGSLRFIVEDLLIQAGDNAIWVDQMWDTSRITRCHVIPGWFSDAAGTLPDGVRSYLASNLVAYQFGHCDSLYLSDCQVYFAMTGVLIEPSPLATSPRDPWIRATNFDIDICDICVDIQSDQPQGIQFTNGSWTTFQSDETPNAIALRIGANAGDVSISNAAILSLEGREVRQAGGDLALTGCRLDSFLPRFGGSTPSDSPSIVTTGGNVSVTGCVFRDNRTPLAFSGGGKGTFTGCRAQAPPTDSNNPSRVAQTGSN